MRQVVLDTETTGLEVRAGHRIIEIGCVEIVDRRITGRHFHRYVNPGRDIEAGAVDVHGITLADLADKPAFADVIADLLRFIDGAEVLIHNAEFDVGFINNEFRIAGHEPCELGAFCTVKDTLALARSMYPGQRCSLDALCKRLDVDNSQRQLHGALLDAEILADVYLMMTGGQSALALGGLEAGNAASAETAEPRRAVQRAAGMVLAVVAPTAAERAAHEALVAELGPEAVWKRV